MVEVAVAVSGGADSIALLRLAVAQFGRAGVVALAVDHRTRSRATVGERALVEATTVRLCVAYRRLMIADGLATQAGWRNARLATLLRFCRTAGIWRLWLGHHADDALETVAIRLLAGSPLTGAAGISAERHVEGLRIERPLLGAQARALRRGLMQESQVWVEDPSNRSTRYKRVAVRQALSGLSAPNAVSLVRRVGHWRAARGRVLTEAWRLVAGQGPFGAVVFDCRRLALLPGSLRLELLRHGALVVTGAPGRWREYELAAMARDGMPRPLGGAGAWRNGGVLWLVREATSIQDLVRLMSGRATVWDQRFVFWFAGQLPLGEWTICALGHRLARRLAVGGPPQAAAALPALWDGPRLAAIPALGVWRGMNGPALAVGLGYKSVSADRIPLFRLVTGMH